MYQVGSQSECTWEATIPRNTGQRIPSLGVGGHPDWEIQVIIKKNMLSGTRVAA